LLFRNENLGNLNAGSFGEDITASGFTGNGCGLSATISGWI
jgi:hypothetical protein